MDVLEVQGLNPNNNIMEAAAAASGQAAAGSLLVPVLVPVEARLQLHSSAPSPGLLPQFSSIHTHNKAGIL